jgi:thioredoxin 1
MIKVELIALPGCAKCAAARQELKQFVETLDPDKFLWREVNPLDEIDYAVELGVLSAPAIAIDGRLVFASLPSVSALRSALANHLAR